MAENREMTLGRFVTAANEVTIGGFWREHAKNELKTRKNHEILRFLSPCWEKKYMGRVFYAGDAIFDAFVQELLNMPINLVLALYLVYPRYVFIMGPAYMFSRGVEMHNTGTLDPLTWIHNTGTHVMTHGELMAFHRLMKYGEPLKYKEGSPKCGKLFIQLFCRAEDDAGGVSPNAESILDGRGEKSQDEGRVEGGEWRYNSLD